MELRREEARQGSTKMTPLLCFILYLFFVQTLITGASFITDSAVSNSSRAVTSSKVITQHVCQERTRRTTGGDARRGLAKWPGSVPPRCKFKCGECNPCRPVHVPVPPSRAVTDEYYPEAWRCKCGNRLFMP